MRTELLAAISDLAPPSARALPAGQSSSPVAGDVVLVLALGLALTAILVLLVYYRHRRRLQLTGGRGGSSGGSGRTSVAGANGAGQFGRRRRMRRNPTLAETGGLPPPRGDREPSPPAA